MKKSIISISLIVVILTATIWQCIGAWQDSQTTDEAVHLVSGVSYWQTGDFKLNPEHPALFKLLASLPLVLIPHTQIPVDSETWHSGNQWTIGAQYVHYSPVQQRYGSHFIMLVGRLPMIMIWLGLLIMTAVWTWRNWGALPSLTASTFLAYDPNLLGHGHLVTNDVAVAFVFLGTMLLVRRLIYSPRWKNVLMLAFVFALAQLTKFSAIILWLIVPVVLLMALIYNQKHWNWAWFRRTIFSCLAISLFTTWIVYGLQWQKISADPHIGELWSVRQQIVDNREVDTLPPIMRVIVRLSNPSSVTGKMLEHAQQLTIPSYWYWRGFFSATTHNMYGHNAYLMGQTSEIGWWYYFPIALLIKTPLPLLLIVLLWTFSSIGVTLARLRRHQRPYIPLEFWFLGFPPLAFLLVSMAGHVNIGVRHVFPTYVFFPLTAAALVMFLQRHHRHLAPLVAGTLITSSVIIGTMAWPNTIGYFNGFIGGTKEGHRYIADSNLDWNQDFWRLRSFFDQHHFPEIHIALFGSIPTNLYFPEAGNILSDDQIQSGIRPTGVIAISDNMLYAFDNPFHWLRSVSPTWRVGSSIAVYDFR